MTLQTIADGNIASWRMDKFPNRPTIVFLHDSLGCIELWRQFPEQLAERTCCNALVYDRHGYGQSGPFNCSTRSNDYLEKEAHILAELLDTCDIDEAILFGHSDGGSIALIAAALYPEKIKVVITEGAHIFVEEETLVGIREAALAYQLTDLKARLEKYHGGKTDALFHAWTETWMSDSFRNWNIEGFLPSVRCPVLVIQGEADEYGTLAQVDGIAGQVSGNVQKLLIPGVRHTPHKEVPGFILETASRFISEVCLTDDKRVK